MISYVKRPRYKLKRGRKTSIPYVHVLILPIFLLIAVSILIVYQKSKSGGIKNTQEFFTNSPKSCINQEFIRNQNNSDKDNDQIDDGYDIYLSALKRTQVDVEYIDQYYSTNNGKPPDSEGVCTDVVWRALEGAGYDFQKLLDADIRANSSNYPLSIWGQTSANLYIDFRRVPNIEEYLKKNAQTLTTDLKKCNYENLSEWQPGDIVIFNLDGVGPSDHIAIVSEKRDVDGVPYVIHNWGFGTREDKKYWGDIVGHYRWVE